MASAGSGGWCSGHATPRRASTSWRSTTPLWTSTTCGKANSHSRSSGTSSQQLVLSLVFFFFVIPSPSPALRKTYRLASLSEELRTPGRTKECICGTAAVCLSCLKCAAGALFALVFDYVVPPRGGMKPLMLYATASGALRWLSVFSPPPRERPCYLRAVFTQRAHEDPLSRPCLATSRSGDPGAALAGAVASISP